MREEARKKREREAEARSEFLKLINVRRRCT